MMQRERTRRDAARTATAPQRPHCKESILQQVGSRVLRGRSGCATSARAAAVMYLDGLDSRGPLPS